jgi:hypothetical protein
MLPPRLPLLLLLLRLAAVRAGDEAASSTEWSCSRWSVAEAAAQQSRLRLTLVKMASRRGLNHRPVTR